MCNTAVQCMQWFHIVQNSCELRQVHVLGNAVHCARVLELRFSGIMSESTDA